MSSLVVFVDSFVDSALKMIAQRQMLHEMKNIMENIQLWCVLSLIFLTVILKLFINIALWIVIVWRSRWSRTWLLVNYSRNHLIVRKWFSPGNLDCWKSCTDCFLSSLLAPSCHSHVPRLCNKHSCLLYFWCEKLRHDSVLEFCVLTVQFRL